MKQQQVKKVEPFDPPKSGFKKGNLPNTISVRKSRQKREEWLEEEHNAYYFQ